MQEIKLGLNCPKCGNIMLANNSQFTCSRCGLTLLKMNDFNLSCLVCMNPNFIYSYKKNFVLYPNIPYNDIDRGDAPVLILCSNIKCPSWKVSHSKNNLNIFHNGRKLFKFSLKLRNWNTYEELGIVTGHGQRKLEELVRLQGFERFLLK